MFVVTAVDASMTLQNRLCRWAHPRQRCWPSWASSPSPTAWSSARCRSRVTYPAGIPPCALVQTPSCLCLHPSCSFLMHSIRSVHTYCSACHDGLKQLKSLRCFKL